MKSLFKKTTKSASGKVQELSANELRNINGGGDPIVSVGSTELKASDGKKHFEVTTK